MILGILISAFIVLVILHIYDINEEIKKEIDICERELQLLPLSTYESTQFYNLYLHYHYKLYGEVFKHDRYFDKTIKEIIRILKLKDFTYA